MHQRAVRALCCAALLTTASGASAQEPGAPTTEPAQPEAASAPEDPPEARAIEDVGLDELLGLELADTLGTTEAISRSREDVLAAPATLSTLDAASIRLSGARTIPDLLRFVPGVQVVQTAPSIYLVALRGMSGLTGNNVVVTVDGVPINNPLDGSLNWGLLPIGVRDVERIEVVRGPVSTIYGANAYTGVINIVTFRGFGSEPQYGVRVEGGSDLRGSPSSTLGLHWVQNGKRRQHALFAEGGLDGAHRTAESGGAHPALQRGALLGRLGFTLPAGQLDFELGASYGKQPSIEHLSLEHQAERRLVSFAAAQFLSKNPAGALGVVRVWARSGLQRSDADRSRFAGFTYAGTRSSRTSLGLDLDVELHRTLVTTFGGQFDLDRVSAPYLDARESGAFRSGFGFYNLTKWEPTTYLSFTGAVRGDVPTVTAKTEPSYRFSAVYHRANYGLRAAVASSYRAPTYVEAGGRFVDRSSGLLLLEGAPNIAYPRNDAAELGLLYSPRVDLSLAATAYGARMRNLTVEEFVPIVRRSFVAARNDTYLVGAELDGKWVISDAFTWRVFASYVRHYEDFGSRVPTAGSSDMNSTIIAGSELRGGLRRDRLHYGLGAVLSSGRTYAIASGIPPVVATRDVRLSTVITAMIEHELGRAWPVWLSCRVQAHVPEQVESPVPGASKIGSTATVGLARRWGE